MLTCGNFSIFCGLSQYLNFSKLVVIREREKTGDIIYGSPQSRNDPLLQKEKSKKAKMKVSGPTCQMVQQPKVSYWIEYWENKFVNVE